MRFRTRALTAVAAVLAGLTPIAVAAATPPPAEQADTATVAPAQRESVLGKDYRSSTDRAVTTSGDADGFHVLVADQSAGYTWRTAATLREPGFDTDLWIGNACVTAAGTRAVVVYAPRAFTNKPELMARGGFTAVVDLVSGAVTRLPLRATLSYYSPGCGADESAIFTQTGGESHSATRLVRVDAAVASAAAPLRVAGQITSAVPGKGGAIIAADGPRVVAFDPTGDRVQLAATRGVPFRIIPDTDGGVTYLDPTADHRVTAQHLTTKGSSPVQLADGPIDRMSITRDTTSHAYLTGEAHRTDATLPAAVRVLPDTPTGALVTTTGKAVVTRTRWADGGDSRTAATAARPTAVDLTVLGTGKKVSFTVDPSTDTEVGAGLLATAPQPPGSATDPVEADRVCSVPRNDPRNQALQPKPRQVEWAVDQAIMGTLNQNTSRPANWKNLGMPAYAPQTLFPKVPLVGTTNGHVPAQILLGVAAQESNMWQASRVAVPGVTANPLIGNYYGIDYYDGNPNNDWDVDWPKADCGYGVTQVTDHMRLSGQEDGKAIAWPYQTQRAVALDYVTNIAAGLQILTGKWNDTRDAGLVVNNGDSSKLENWFFALWAYNSGFYAQSTASANGGAWGVGWANNPANPEWDAGRAPFLEISYADAAHPQNWPYQEKVLGFAGHPIEGLESPGTTVAGFRAGWWNGDNISSINNRIAVKPPESLFCTSDNTCDAAKISDGAANDAGAGPCGRADLRCWWNKPVTWKTDCTLTCGNETVRFNATYPEEADGAAYPPTCALTGLPAGALVVDDVPDAVPSVRPGCTRSWTGAGTFGLEFSGGRPAQGYAAKIDTQQLGAGFGGHTWFAHTRADDVKGNALKVTGTWRFAQAVNGPARILVHVPSIGAQTQNAVYQVETAGGVRTRTADQKGTSNHWVSLGAFLFDKAPKVTLTSIVNGGTGDEDIAFDAVAVVPIKGRYVERAFEAASIYDANQNIDTNMPFEINTPVRTMSTLYDWALSNSYQGPTWDDPSKHHDGITAFPRCATPGDFNGDAHCVGQTTWDAANTWHGQVVAGGKTVDPNGGLPQMSEPIWMAMANPRPDPAADPAVAFADSFSYKIRSTVTASFVVDDTGKIVAGSENTDADARTGDAHLPPMVIDIMKGIQTDYGIAVPDISFVGQDSGVWGVTKPADPMVTGTVPGQAFKPHQRGGRIDSDGTCLDTRLVAGGVHGFRAMIAHTQVDANVKAWVGKVVNDNRVSPGLAAYVRDLYSMFFKNKSIPGTDGNTFGSTMGNAPPIWHDISIAFCADGSVKPTHLASNRDATPVDGIVYQSYMPDLYLYLDGRMVDNLGHPAAGPVSKGNWINFSNIPGVNSDAGNAFSKCDSSRRGSGGNPWNVGVPFPLFGDSPDYRPVRVVHCDEPAAYFLATYTP
ncbi:MAG: hypothetical protein ABIQ18_29265 [Umezawaea sp.]